MKEHRPGVRSEYLMERHLKLEGFAPVEALSMVREIDRLPGVDRVSLDEGRRILVVAYDASRASIDQFELVLARHNCDLSYGWWSRFRESWYRHTDDNIRERSRMKPWTCHRID